MPSVRDFVKAERAIARQQLVSQVMQLRLSGHSYDSIAQLLGLPRSRVVRIVERELDRAYREPVEMLLQLELDRLDALMRAYWDAALAGDGEAADRVLRIMDRRARYLGLDRQDTVQEDLGKAVLALVSRLQEMTGGQQPTALPEAIDASYRVIASNDAADQETADPGTSSGAEPDR